MANRYWISGTGNWSDTGHWSTTSGGAGGAAVPTSSDDVFLDANSGVGTVTANAGADRVCNHFNSTNYAGTLSVNSGEVVVYGNLTLGSGTTIVAGGGGFTMAAGSGSITITTNGVSVPELQIGSSLVGSSTATFTLQDNLTINGLTGILEMLYGTFDANDFDVTIERLRNAGGGDTSSILTGTGTWTLTGTGDLLDTLFSGMLTLEGATFVVTDTSATAKNYELNGAHIPSITLPTSTAVHTFLNSGTIDALIIPAGSTVKFDADKQFSIGAITIDGTSSSRITLSSDSAGTQATLYFQGQDAEGSYVTVQDIEVQTNYLFVGIESIDNGNNDHVIFNDFDGWLASRTVRSVAQSLQVSWKKDFLPSITFFTIGVSSIGGNDIISPTEQIDSQWNKYLYFDESAYVEQLEWEHSLSMPMGGISVGMAAGSLDNTSGRFTPRYMGGNSELFTAVLPRRPFIINAGFENQDVEYTYPQFVGLFNKQPRVDTRSKRVDFSGVDFVNFLQNRYVDDEAIFTGQRSDQLIETILQSQGFTTGQYDLDTGINIINFAIFRRGERFGQIIDDIAKAEYAQFYQNHQGILKFENRQHWDNDTNVDYLLLTSQVLEARAPDVDHIVNVVEVKSDVRGKQPEQTIFRLATFNSIEIAASGTTEVFIDFENPALSLTTPTSSSTTSFFVANSESDGTGTNVSASVTINKVDKFSNAAKFIFSNSSGNVAYITELVVSGRTAPILKNIYYRSQDDSSVTAYEEHPYLIENDYIQDETWAMSYAEMVLTDFGEPENLIDLRIRAIPELVLGDLVSWQGRHWRVFSKSSILNAGQGFVQDIKLLRREITTYFRIGISTIGGTDKIAP